MTFNLGVVANSRSIKRTYFSHIINSLRDCVLPVDLKTELRVRVRVCGGECDVIEEDPAGAGDVQAVQGGVGPGPVGVLLVQAVLLVKN